MLFSSYVVFRLKGFVSIFWNSTNMFTLPAVGLEIQNKEVTDGNHAPEIEISGRPRDFVLLPVC